MNELNVHRGGKGGGRGERGQKNERKERIKESERKLKISAEFEWYTKTDAEEDREENRRGLDLSVLL